MEKFWMIFFLLIGFSHSQVLGQQVEMTFENYLREGAPTKREIDVFLHERSWAKFDPELGYVLGNYAPQDGISSSTTISTSQANGSRTSFVYADLPSRINTYGNSFTQCHQVSDAETWQEYLAGHLGEPIRNFGMGGYGVYQSFRRMLKEEATESAAENVLFYIWGGDHIRSLFRCRYMAFREWTERNNELEGEGVMFHGNFWPNIEMDLESGILVEHPSRISSAEELYQMNDPEWLVENLAGDLALEMFLFIQNKIDRVNIPRLKRLSAHLELSLDWQESELKNTVTKLLDAYAFSATKYILTKARIFAETNRKKLLIVLFDPYRSLRSMLNGQSRYDQEIVDFLQANQFHYFDMNVAHVEDFQDFDLSIEQYYDRYLIGHYNPSGNHFFAYQIKAAVIEMLDPKPFPYANKDQRNIEFNGYLNRY